MNCDEAFGVLTRGPFPSGDVDVDDAVERHLTACHTCRHLAEALRPAVGIFHEAMLETDSLTLPGYHGELSPAGDGTVLTFAAPDEMTSRMSPVDAQRSSRKGAVRLWPFAAAGLMGLVVGIFGENIRSRPATEIAATFASAGSHQLVSHPVNREARLLLASLNLPTACRDTSGGSGPNTSSWYQCCTRCHAAAESAAAPAVPLPTLTSSCLVCHSNAYRAEVSSSFRPLQRDAKTVVRAAEIVRGETGNRGPVLDHRLNEVGVVRDRKLTQRRLFPRGLGGPAPPEPDSPFRNPSHVSDIA